MFSFDDTTTTVGHNYNMLTHPASQLFCALAEPRSIHPDPSFEKNDLAFRYSILRNHRLVHGHAFRGNLNLLALSSYYLFFKIVCGN
jgi:hypothetical protein